jgi:hypothetical protein
MDRGYRIHPQAVAWHVQESSLTLSYLLPHSTLPSPHSLFLASFLIRPYLLQCSSLHPPSIFPFSSLNLPTSSFALSHLFPHSSLPSSSLSPTFFPTLPYFLPSLDFPPLFLPLLQASLLSPSPVRREYLPHFPPHKYVLPKEYEKNFYNETHYLCCTKLRN